MDKRIGTPRRRKTETPGFFRRNLGAILGLALAAIGVHNLFGEHGFIAMRRMQAEASSLRADIEKLNKENAALGEQVKGLKTDPEMIERIAREELGLAREGERVFKLPPKKQQD